MRTRFTFTLIILSLFAWPVHGQSIEDESIAWLQDFIRVDTVNPPGNESRAVDFIAAILDAEGIAWQSAESAPGRGNIWARLEGGHEPALILMQHTDVVPVDPSYWMNDPLSGEIRDGYIWGRGALDMKGAGMSQLASFISLQRAGKPLNRDVILLATADEEAGGVFGAGWLIEHHPEIFAGAGLLINEGGSGIDVDGERVFKVEVTQKVPVWLRLSAVDTPGHGATPFVTSSITRIVEALNRLRVSPFPPRIVPAVDRMFQGLSESMSGEWAGIYGDIASAIKRPGFLGKLQEYSPPMHALVRDTCALTRMQGSGKINVVPPEAWAEIDCRVLPDKPSDVFVNEVRDLLDGTGVEVEVLMAFTPAVTSIDTRLYKAIESVTAQRHMGSRVVPVVLTGFTDSHYTRDLGIASYGFNPLVVLQADAMRVHGIDERVSVAAYRQSAGDLLAIIGAVVYD